MYTITLQTNIEDKPEVQLSLNIATILKYERECKKSLITFFVPDADGQMPKPSITDIVELLKYALPNQDGKLANDIVEAKIKQEGIKAIYDIYVKLGEACNFFTQANPEQEE